MSQTETAPPFGSGLCLKLIITPDGETTVLFAKWNDNRLICPQILRRHGSDTVGDTVARISRICSFLCHLDYVCIKTTLICREALNLAANCSAVKTVVKWVNIWGWTPAAVLLKDYSFTWNHLESISGGSEQFWNPSFLSLFTRGSDEPIIERSLTNKRRRIFFSHCDDGDTNDGDDEGWKWGRSMHLPTIDWSSAIDCPLPWKQRPLRRARYARQFGVGGQVGR